MEHTHLICIIFCVYVAHTVYKRTIAFEPQPPHPQSLPLMTTIWRSLLLMPICFDVIEMVIWKIWAIKILRTRYWSKREPFSSCFFSFWLLLEHTQILTTKVFFEIQSVWMYTNATVHFFSVGCLLRKTTLRHHWKREKYFQAHTNKINTHTERGISRDACVYVCNALIPQNIFIYLRRVQNSVCAYFFRNVFFANIYSIMLMKRVT